MKVLIPVPSRDFDPTESAVPWKYLKSQGLEISVATPDAKPARADQRMIDGNRLGLLKPFLVADKNGRAAYAEFEVSQEFRNPISWDRAKSENFDGIILPGGHAQGMREYLESATLQSLVAAFFAKKKTVGAICHGVVLAARSKNNGVSVLKGRKTTALLRSQETLAHNMTRLWLGNYYRTYDQTVEDEVTAALASPADFVHGPFPKFRDSLEHLEHGFTMRDENYISARWPGDAHAFAVGFVKTMQINS